MNANHPYHRRLMIRQLFHFHYGLGDKGEDCEVVGAEHHWYNEDGFHSACYYCRVIATGHLWATAFSGVRRPSWLRLDS